MQHINLSVTAKRYLLNFSFATAVLLSISLMFFVQFKVDFLQEKVNEIDMKVSSFEDEMKVMEVEWVYLTRPERLRILSEKYLQNSGYIASNQIKDEAVLQGYYTASLEKAGAKSLAMDDVKQNLN